MAVLTVQEVGAAGLTPAFDPADVAGDEFSLTDHNVLHVKNGGVAEATVTLVTQKPSNYGESNDMPFDVAAGGEVIIRPGAIPGGITRFANANGRAEVTYSDATNLTVAAIGA